MHQLLLLLFALPAFISGLPVSSPEVSSKTGKSNNVQQQQQQQHQNNNLNNNNHNNNNYNKANQQDAHLNQLSVYATNYDVINSNQNSHNPNDEDFKPSYKLPEMETNFIPIQNGNSIAPDFASQVSGGVTPLIMHYMPQTVMGEGGVQYLQLIPTRPLIVPISPYLAGNNAAHSLSYPQTISAPGNIDFTARPTTLLNAMPVNVPPPVPTSLMEVSAPPMAAYGIQSYAPQIQQGYKQNFRINRETKDKQMLGPLNLTLNLNEYIPGTQAQNAHSTQIRGRP